MIRLKLNCVLRWCHAWRICVYASGLILFAHSRLLYTCNTHNDWWSFLFNFILRVYCTVNISENDSLCVFLSACLVSTAIIINTKQEQQRWCMMFGLMGIEKFSEENKQVCLWQKKIYFGRFFWKNQQKFWRRRQKKETHVETQDCPKFFRLFLDSVACILNLVTFSKFFSCEADY